MCCSPAAGPGNQVVAKVQPTEPASKHAPAQQLRSCGCEKGGEPHTLAGTRCENLVNCSSWVPWKGLSGASRRGCCPLAAAEELGELLRTGTSCHCPTAPLGDPLLLLAARLASPAAGASACRAIMDVLSALPWGDASTQEYNTGENLGLCVSGKAQLPDQCQ